MRRKRVLIQALVTLVLLWGIVTVVRVIAGSKQITAEKVRATVEATNFEDWSGHESAPNAARARERDEKLREVAELVNRLDFTEAEKNRDNRSLENMYQLMSREEKVLFANLTVAKSMDRMMQGLDQLPAEQRKQFVERGLQEIRSGKTGGDIARAREIDENLPDLIAQEGMRAYFEKASADLKLELAPIMEEINGVMQGMRGPGPGEFGPGAK
jgi:hypothetical protein